MFDRELPEEAPAQPGFDLFMVSTATKATEDLKNILLDPSHERLRGILLGNLYPGHDNFGVQVRSSGVPDPVDQSFEGRSHVSHKARTSDQPLDSVARVTPVDRNFFGRDHVVPADHDPYYGTTRNRSTGNCNGRFVNT